MVEWLDGQMVPQCGSEIAKEPYNHLAIFNCIQVSTTQVFGLSATRPKKPLLGLPSVRPGKRWVFEKFWRSHRNVKNLVYKVVLTISQDNFIFKDTTTYLKPDVIGKSLVPLGSYPFSTFFFFSNIVLLKILKTVYNHEKFSK
ncbi:hypothetical protein BKI52_11205 [marine bacterium AO1-C]|nr:hypothetical protein BKI52_11205 [marine bacterium AO1-C]